jgi:YegS/Rv2252/BmrU family lipid kinase
VSTSQRAPREAVLIVNAHSRKGQDLFREARERLEAAGVRLIAAHAVRDPRKLRTTVRDAVEGGAPMVIVGGGDGTLSSTVDEIVGKDCAFAVLPLGTANSFARSLGIPLDLEGAVRTIAEGELRRIDLGVIDGDYYANCAALGLSPMIGDTVPHKLKRYLGRIGYLGWAFWCLARFRPFRLTIDDGTKQETLWATEVRIANGPFHGGVELIGEAEVDSGHIVVQAVTGRSRMKLLGNWAAGLMHLSVQEAATQEYRGTRLRIETHPRLPISIDGEVLGRTPATVEVARGAIEVVVPAEGATD